MITLPAVRRLKLDNSYISHALALHLNYHSNSPEIRALNCSCSCTELVKISDNHNHSCGAQGSRNVRRIAVCHNLGDALCIANLHRNMYL